MIHTSVLIKDLGEESPIKEFESRIHERGSIDKVVIEQGGMMSGKTKIVLLINIGTDNDPVYVMGETSAAMWDSINAAIIGSEMRWAQQN